MSEKYYYKMTMFPSIFKDTYWGRFKYDGIDLNKKSIFENRNEFVKSYDIKSIKKNVKIEYRRHIENSLESLKCTIEHMEYYKSINNTLVAVYNPYHLNDGVEEKLIELGWDKYNLLYNHMATTWILVIPYNLPQPLHKEAIPAFKSAFFSKVGTWD